MANKLYEENDIQAIANAIRGKNGSSDTYTVAQMSTAITNIPSGGGGIPANTKLAYEYSSVLNTLIPQVAAISSQYTDMANLFINSEFSNQNLSNWDTSGVSYFSYMFANCTQMTSIDLSSWKNNVSNILTMNNMFQGCNNLTTVNLSGWKLDNVYGFAGMFQSLTNLSTVNLSNWVLGNREYSHLNFNRMFYGCSGLTSLDLSSWTDVNDEYVIPEDVGGMFQGCKNLQTLDLSSFLFSSSYPTVYSNMFGSSSSNRVPADCLIYVNSMSYSWVTTNFNWLTNVQTKS